MSLQTPVQITFHQMESSAAVEAKIHEKVAQLEHLHDGLISCRVVLEHGHFFAHDHKHEHGDHERGPIAARFELGLRGGKTIVGGGAPGKQDGFADADTAIKVAFEAAKRQLQHHVDRRRHYTKVHEVPPHGVITTLDVAGEYGFLQTSDGLDVYFHRNAVVEAEFDDLAVGDQIRFILHAEEGEQGPQAASVQPLGKRSLPDVEVVRS